MAPSSVNVEVIMKRTILLSVSLLCAVTLLFAQPIAESPQEPAQIAVMAGPTGFSSAGLSRFLGEDTYTLSVYPSPNEVIARLANGEVDVAALPSNVAATLYNRGVKIQVAAVIGDGMLSVLSSDPSVADASDLIGKTIHVPGPGSTPDQMARLLLKEAGLVEGVDVIMDYSVSAPAQLAQMVIAGKVSLAILPEPFVTMVRTKNSEVNVAADVQELYSSLTGIENYPMSVLVVRSDFAREHASQLSAILSAYEQSVAWVTANPADAGKAIEEASIMAAAMAAPAIKACNLVYRPASSAKGELDAYYTFLHSFSPDAIGGSVPKADLYQ
jgi:NitT/TauT family transport system substrate-binding protein